MPQNSIGALPFKVSRFSRETLVEQVVNGVRASIVSGRYRPGDILPTTRDMAVELGVSHIVTRGAVKRLASEGLISPKPSIGCVVLGAGERLWKGRILFVTNGAGAGYYEGILMSALRERFLKAGWILAFATVAVEGYGKVDASELELQLRNPTDFAISLFGSRAADRILSRSGVPFVKLEGESKLKPKGCVGFIHYDRRSAADAFAADCVRLGVRSVEEVGFESFDDMKEALEKVGIRFDALTVKRPSAGDNSPEPYAYLSRDAFVRYLKKRGGNLPDVIYFSDDYICRGALAAFAGAGISVPGDVRIATWVNRGNAPVAPCELARIELDPRSDAKGIYDYVLDCLDGKDAVAPVFGTKYETASSMGGAASRRTAAARR